MSTALLLMAYVVLLLGECLPRPMRDPGWSASGVMGVSAQEESGQWRAELLHPDEQRFEAHVNAALQKVAQILDKERAAPALPTAVPHEWSDKFWLASTLTNTAVAAVLNALALLGVKGDALVQMHAWAAAGKSVTLRFSGSDSCSFLREETREVASDTKVVTSGLFGNTQQQVFTTVHEYYFLIELPWQVSVYAGTAVDSALTLTQRHGAFELMTHSRQMPKPEKPREWFQDIDITWMLQQMLLTDDVHTPGSGDSNTAHRFNFTIDRSALSTRTPRRNADVQAALEFSAQLHSWGQRVSMRLVHFVFPTELADAVKSHHLHDREIFVPLLPLFQPHPDATAKARAKRKQVLDRQGKSNGEGASDASANQASCEAGPPSFAPCTSPSGSVSPLLSRTDVAALLSEQRRTLQAKLSSLAKTLHPPEARSLITTAEAQVLLSTLHLQTLLLAYADGINSIESQLRSQLSAAIGSELTSADFESYMRASHPRLFKAAYQPQPFVFAVRRPEHAPEGTVSITSQPLESDGSANTAPFATVSTFSRSLTAEERLQLTFRLSAATKVRFTGSQSVHAYVPHQFGSESSSRLSLECRARAFSSFLVVLGSFISPTEIDPSYAFILQNSDDLSIPLLLKQLPSAGEFDDAIRSLSPAQQRFAQAIRSLQLSGSVFGMVVIQLKPQLERLLRLPVDSLTKEVALTQTLLELFIRYQIPSDLLTVDELDEKSMPNQPIAAVKAHAAALKAMILEQEDAMLAEAKKQREMEGVEREAMDAKLRRIHASTFSVAPNYSATISAQAAQLDGYQFKITRLADPSGGFAASAPPQADARQKDTNEESAGEGESEKREGRVLDSEEVRGFDFTSLPARFDAALRARSLARKGTELSDEWSGFLRPTTVRVGQRWKKRSVKSLLSKTFDTDNLWRGEQQLEKEAAFDLLDALSRSGALVLESTDLHVLVALTHHFDRSLIDTLVIDNVNPIEKLEDALATLVAALHDTTEDKIMTSEQFKRLQKRRAEGSTDTEDPAPSAPLNAARL